MDRDQFVIIDASSMIWRALHKKGPPLTSPTREPTRGTYFFCEMLFEIVGRLQPAYLAMAMDAPRDTTWRRELFPAYKEKRDEHELDESIPIQMRRIQEIIGALGITRVGADSYEADDVIATLVDVCASEEVECIVVSRDKDLHQLVGPNCRILNVQDDAWYDERAVQDKWGVPPKQVVEIQTLAGDTTDGVPGVPGIGMKKALALIQRFGSVENVLKSLDLLTPAQQKAFRDADLTLCRQLVELRRDVPLHVTAKSLEFDGFDMDRARPIFRKLGFRKWS